jgi:hypothetical protein
LQLFHCFWNMKQNLSLTLFFVPMLHNMLVYCNTTYNTWPMAP